MARIGDISRQYVVYQNVPVAPASPALQQGHNIVECRGWNALFTNQISIKELYYYFCEDELSAALIEA
jgi:hypothetical protein